MCPLVLVHRVIVSEEIIIFSLLISTFFLFFWDTGLFSLSWCGALYVDQAGLELTETHRNPPAPVSLVLGLKVCATTPSKFFLMCICTLNSNNQLIINHAPIQRNQYLLYIQCNLDF